MEEVKPLLRKTETDFPDKDSYKQLKDKILIIFGPKPEEAIERALGRVMTSTPSNLARALVNDICKSELDCECCPSIVMALWKRHLSESVRAGIAEYEMDKDNFEQLVTLADRIHNSRSRLATVASVAAPAGAGLDETQPAIPYAAPEVAALQRGGRGGRGGRGNRRGGRGQNRGGRGGAGSQPAAAGTGPKHKGTKHPDLPAGTWTGCSMHFRWGRGAHFCSEPGSCPWKNIFTPKE